MAEGPNGQQNFVFKKFHKNKLSHFSSEISKLDSKSQIQQLKQCSSKIKQSKSLQTITLKNKNNIYINFGLTKTQPQISRMQFPYFIEEDVPEKQIKKMSNLKITNRVFTKKNENSNFREFSFNRIENEEPPINQFLCYDLSRQINSGLYEVKVLAEEIKKIKKQKLQTLEDRTKYKPKNKIRIVKNYKGPILGKDPNKSITQQDSDRVQCKPKFR